MESMCRISLNAVQMMKTPPARTMTLWMLNSAWNSLPR